MSWELTASRTSAGPQAWQNLALGQGSDARQGQRWPHFSSLAQRAELGRFTQGAAQGRQQPSVAQGSKQGTHPCCMCVTLGKAPEQRAADDAAAAAQESSQMIILHMYKEHVLPQTRAVDSGNGTPYHCLRLPAHHEHDISMAANSN